MSMTTASAHFAQAQALFRCPLCGADMVLHTNSLVCSNRHCFDLSKYGYINFAPASKGALYTGELFDNRRAVFAAGFYEPVVEALEQLVCLTGSAAATRVLDVGCGEGYYAAALAKRPGLEVYAMDLSKQAIVLAAKGCKTVWWMVGDLAAIPLQDGCMDVLLNILTPANYGEFTRVLRPDGQVVKVVPGEGYLQELRAAAGKEGYSNAQVAAHFADNMMVMARKRVTYKVEIDAMQAAYFAHMTPMLSDTDMALPDVRAVRRITIDLELLVGTPKK